MKIKANKTIESKAKRVNNDGKIEDKTTFFYYAFRNILLVSLPLLLVSTFVLSLPHSSATESSSSSNSNVDSVSLSLDISCTISSEVLEPHSVSLSGGGLHRENIGTTKIGAFCNDNNGYNIYAIGYSNNTDGNTDLVSNLMDDYNIHTGIYSSGNTTSSWGMKVTAGTGTGINPDTGASVITTPPTINNGYNNYNVVPNVYTKVASRASSTNMNTDIDVDATGSYFTTTYDIYANSAQPAGTYVGKVKYIMTHPNTNAPNTINDIDAAFAIAGKQKIYYDENDNGPYFAMQDMTTDICNSITRNGELTATQLVDVRDKKSYYVTKLKDGHCWMTQNLDFDINPNEPLTSNDTDLTDHSLAGAYIDGYSYDENTGITTWIPNSTTASLSSFGQSNTLPYSVESSGIYFYTSNSNENDIKYSSLSECINAGHIETECKHYSVGNYYNWTAAIASNNSTNISTQYNVANNSICPKGWRLPIATNSNESIYEFGNLLSIHSITTSETSTSYTATGFNDIRKSPLWFVRGGRTYNRSLTYGMNIGNYWSSVVNGTGRAYDLDFSSTMIRPAYNINDRHLGESVRCLAR